MPLNSEIYRASKNGREFNYCDSSLNSRDLNQAFNGLKLRLERPFAWIKGVSTLDDRAIWSLDVPLQSDLIEAAGFNQDEVTATFFVSQRVYRLEHSDFSIFQAEIRAKDREVLDRTRQFMVNFPNAEKTNLYAYTLEGDLDFPATPPRREIFGDFLLPPSVPGRLSQAKQLLARSFTR